MSRESEARRNRIWRHNGFTGSAVMMEKQLKDMLSSSTITPATRSRIETTLIHVKILQGLLKERRE